MTRQYFEYAAQGGKAFTPEMVENVNKLVDALLAQAKRHDVGILTSAWLSALASIASECNPDQQKVYAQSLIDTGQRLYAQASIKQEAYNSLDYIPFGVLEHYMQERQEEDKNRPLNQELKDTIERYIKKRKVQSHE